MIPKLEIYIDNKKIDDLLEASFNFSLLAISSATFLISNNSSNRELLEPFTYKKVIAMANNKILFTGKVEIVSIINSANNILIKSFSLINALLKSCITSDFTFNDQTLTSIATNLCSPYNIVVASPSGESKLVKVINFGINETVIGALNRISGLFNILAKPILFGDNNLGDLVIGKNIDVSPPINSFSSGKFPFVKGIAIFNGNNRYSEYKIFSQISNQTNLNSSLTDNEIKDKRIFSAKEKGYTQDELNNLCLKRQYMDALYSVNIKLDIANTVDSLGNIYEVGKTIDLEIPELLLNGSYQIIRVELFQELNPDTVCRLTVAPKDK